MYPIVIMEIALQLFFDEVCFPTTYNESVMTRTFILAGV